MSDTEILHEWQRRRLMCFDKKAILNTAGPKSVTVLTYFFWPEGVAEEKFPYLQCAIQETWRNCGMLKTIIVSNRSIQAIEAFRLQYADWVSIQIEPLLVPGDINSLSIDCNAKLYSRFSSKYVLIIQDHGSPIRPGLSRFLGNYDFIGAPLRRCCFMGGLASIVLRYTPSNGGFSIRSRRICRLASEYYAKYYSNRSFSSELVEDCFYTKTLPMRFLRCRLLTHIAGPFVANDFSYEPFFPNQKVRFPFGFHNANSFVLLLKKNLIFV